MQFISINTTYEGGNGVEYEFIKSFFNVKHRSKDQCMAICSCHSVTVMAFILNTDLVVQEPYCEHPIESRRLLG